MASDLVRPSLGALQSHLWQWSERCLHLYHLCSHLFTTCKVILFCCFLSLAALFVVDMCVFMWLECTLGAACADRSVDGQATTWWQVTSNAYFNVVFMTTIGYGAILYPNSASGRTYLAVLACFTTPSFFLSLLFLLFSLSFSF